MTRGSKVIIRRIENYLGDDRTATRHEIYHYLNEYKHGVVGAQLNNILRKKQFELQENGKYKYKVISSLITTD